MAGLNRYFLDNRMFDASMVYAPSSEEGQLPAEHLRDQLRQAVWQTKGPFVITADNCYIDFNRGGVKAAIIALGVYATGTALCAAIVTALGVADPPAAGLTWAADYNIAAANKFRIRNTAGAPVSFDLLWNTGVNKYRSIGEDLGFSVAANSGSVTTQTAATVSYQSRHFLMVNQSDAANIRAAVAVLLQHNLQSGATVKWEANSTVSWATPASSNTVSVAGDPHTSLFAPVVVQPFHRLTINDTQNPDGFFQCGVIYLGEYVTPNLCCSESFAFTQEDFSQRVDSISGASFVSGEPDREAFPLEYTDVADGSPDESTFDAVRAQPVGLCFFFQFDTTNPASLYYVAKVAGSSKQCSAGGLYWTYQLPLTEML